MFTTDTYGFRGLAVVTVVGDVDLATADRLLAVIGSRLSPGVTGVVVDCRGIEFIDSTGLRALLRAQELATAVGMGFALTAPSPALDRVMKLADVGRLFQVYRDVMHAWEASSDPLEPQVP